MKLDNVEDIYELSPLQEGMLFHTLMTPGSGMYFEQVGFPLPGPLDVQSFERAWQKVLDRHTILRTSFHWEDLDKPLQVVHRTVKLPFEYLDWSNLSAAGQQQRLDAFLAADRERGFELSEAPLLRLAVIALAGGAWYFVFSLHHVLLDGWSSDLVCKEAAATYEGLCRGEQLEFPPCRPYGDYIAWLQEQDLSAAELFWRRIFTGYAGPSPMGAGQRLTEEAGGDEQQIQLPAATTMVLQSMARQHRLTLNTLIQGAWALLMSRYSGDDDVVFGCTVSGRPASLPGAESMVGLFINTLPLRVQVSSDARLVPWLKQIQASQFEARNYEYSPLVKIQEWSQTARGTPLFNSIVDFGNFPIAGAGRDQRVGISGVRSYTRTNYPLNLLVWPASELVLKIIHRHRCFESDGIARMLGHLRTILEGMVAGAEQRLGDLPLLTEPERRQLLVEWNETATEFPREAVVHRLFEEQVERTPEALAVVFGDELVTYSELNARANRLAHHLRALGVGPEAVVGLCVERSVEMVVALLAILKAGGAYLPLDAEYPAERLRFMLEDAGVGVVVTRERVVERLHQHGAAVVCLDRDRDIIARHSALNPATRVVADNPVYVMFTSGSTGTPKGITIVHRSVVRLVTETSYASLTADEVFLQLAPISFDASTLEIWGALLNGARLVVFPPHQPSLEELGRALVEYKVSTLWLTAGLFHQMVESQLEALRGVRQLLAGGDILSVAAVTKVLGEISGCRVINGYGPTENTTFTCCHGMSDESDVGETVSIGRPVANTEVYVLDARMQPVAVGVTGELYIGGAGLARGYLHRAALTAEKFLPHPYSRSGGERLYRTGDLVRYIADGRLEFIGRADHQVKIRGFRVELGEIEAVLGNHPGVRDVVVLARQDVLAQLRLVAYVVALDEQRILTASELRSYLKENLPEHMVPSVFMLLDELPLTPNGKVDRGALPSPDDQGMALHTKYVAPRTPLEEDLASIWSEILGVRQVGVDDNFFHLGGHSLLAMRLVSRVRGAFQIELPLRELFESPTVAGLARSIQDQQVKGRERPIAPLTSTASGPQVKGLSDEEVNRMLSDVLEQRHPEQTKRDDALR